MNGETALSRVAMRAMARGLAAVNLAGCLLWSASIGAVAYSSVSSCDLIALRSAEGGDFKLSDASWGAHRNQVASALENARDRGLSDGDLGRQIVALQEAVVKSVPAPSLEAYRKSPRCVLLVGLTPGFTSAFGNLPAIDPRFARFAAPLQRLTRAALQDLDEKLSRIRFASRENQMFFQAGYLCFAASLAYLASPPEKQEASTLRSFGETRTCSGLGRPR